MVPDRVCLSSKTSGLGGTPSWGSALCQSQPVRLVFSAWHPPLQNRPSEWAWLSVQQHSPLEGLKR